MRRIWWGSGCAAESPRSRSRLLCLRTRRRLGLLCRGLGRGGGGYMWVLLGGICRFRWRGGSWISGVWFVKAHWPRLSYSRVIRCYSMSPKLKRPLRNSCRALKSLCPRLHIELRACLARCLQELYQTTNILLTFMVSTYRCGSFLHNARSHQVPFWLHKACHWSRVRLLFEAMA